MLSSFLLLLSNFAQTSCKPTFFGLKSWDYYLTTDAARGCAIVNFHVLGGNSSILMIVLAIIDDLLRVAGMLAVIIIIYSGFQFITSSGSADNAAKARQTGINALIGLGIAMVSIPFIEFIGQQLGTGNASAGNNPNGLDITPLPNPATANGEFLHVALGIAFGVLGALAFMIIVIAGMRYTYSQGDPKATAEARSTIIYAIVGLVIAIAAESIVSLALH